MMGTRTGKQCRERYINHLDPDTKRSAWTTEEDNVIRNLFKTVGTKWSQYMDHLPGRSDNAIKNRYHVINRFGMSPRGGGAGATAGVKRSTSDATGSSTETGQREESKPNLDEERQQKRLKRLQTAREILDQRIRELEDGGSHPSGASSPSSSDLSTTFCEETLKSELGSAFDDLEFIREEKAAMPGEKAEVGTTEPAAADPDPSTRFVPSMPFDFSCYDMGN